MAFKSIVTSGASLESPEALFRDIRTKKILGLLSQQADLLREYTSRATNEPDVALQLPTGSGKTLVGLLLGEWRRRKLGERVVYLCPTIQLVHQVAYQAASQYGIKVNVFVGKKSDYDPAAKAEYHGAETIAVTNYSSLFNVSPFFENPNVVILDDAHSGENYIPKMWSMRILRGEQEELYEAVAGVFLNQLSWADQQRVRGGAKSAWDRNWVEKIPTPKFAERIPELIDLLDTRLAEDWTELGFGWRMIRDHLYACHFFLNPREIFIRPLISPTFSHAPFAGATQRVYMSATLGEGGDLERIMGRSKIVRLQVKGWEKQGIGRRFFLFPARSLDQSKTDNVIAQVMERGGRSLVIVPDDESAEHYRDWVQNKLGFATFDARDIENSKTPFTLEDKAVAVVANRYDGIDFPGEECRILIVAGLPRATNLQEKFIIERLGAVALLNDRILTRIVQAFGRCTRSATDYATVIVEGEELMAYLLATDRRSFLHPELQAELQFGIDQSKDQTLTDFVENVGEFLTQSIAWQEADKQIVQIRESLTRKELPGTADLQRVAPIEVEYATALWRGDYPKAFEACRSILGMLDDPALRGYRALWTYLAGSSAWLCFKNGIKGFDQQARAQFAAAQKAAPAISWLVGLTRLDQATVSTPSRDEALALQVENLERILEELGTAHDRKYNEEEKFIAENIMHNENTRFEAAHERLGKFLGFISGKTETTGSPDPWWILHDELCVVFEDHSDAEPSGSLHVTKARQVATHPNWIRENVLSLSKKANILPVLVTPMVLVDRDASPHLKDVSIWSLIEFRAWAKAALQVVRDLRRDFPGSGDLAWRAMAGEKLQAAKLDAASLAGMLLTRSAERVLKEK